MRDETMPEIYRGDLRELVVDRYATLTPDTAVYILCPKHKDTNRPSLRVYANGAKCFTCGAYLTRVEFSNLFSDKERTSARILASTLSRKRVERSLVDPVLAAHSGHQALMDDAGSSPAWDWLEARGINLRMVQQYWIGHNGIAFTLPVWDTPEGNIVTVRYRRDDAIAPHLFKFWGLKGNNDVLLYPHATVQQTIVIVEGEMDALLLRRHGLPAYSFTNGTLAVPKDDDLDRMLPNVSRIILPRDQDAPGRDGTKKLVARLNHWRPEVDVIPMYWPVELGKDVTALWQRADGRFPNLVTMIRGYL
jgi:DNA primase